jgi:hypothetical protein
VWVGRKTFTVHSLSAKSALALAWHLLWGYWVRALWCGLKPRLWLWAVGVQLNAELAATQARVQAPRIGQGGG